MTDNIDMTKIPVGISTCLLGEPVRYNGGHKKSAYCVNTLAEFFEFKPFCPEMAIGLGVPRETIRVVFNRQTEETLVQNQAGTANHQPALSSFADTVLENHNELCGYIVMKDSPSCGMERVKRFNEKGNLQDNRGKGAFTDRLMEACPWLPVEESGRLNDPNLRENFILRVIALHDFKQNVEGNLSAKALIDYHARYKYTLMAHSQVIYKELGRLLSSLKTVDLHEVADLFKQRFMAALAKPAGRKGNTNALMHIQGYLKRDLAKPDKQRLSDVISQYRRGEIPLSAPMTLLSFLL
jgi:uncharacterized protein YbgA (DUF1722 family)/uncharacterized protein YbbK (DUF523 family)